MEHQTGISQIAGTAVIADAIHGVGISGALTAVALGIATSLVVSAIERACAAVVHHWKQAEEDAGTLEAGIPATELPATRKRCRFCSRFVSRYADTCGRCSEKFIKR